MKLKKTLVVIDDGAVHRCDTLTIGDRKWVVQDATGPDFAAPFRALLIEGLHLRVAKPDYGADFVLDEVVPKEVWSGTRQDARFTTQTHPPIVPTPKIRGRQRARAR